MRRGGNSKLREWFSERGVPNNMRISAKYHTPDAEYYGKRLKAQVEGKEVPAMPPRMPVDTSIDYSKGDPKGKEKLQGESDEDYIARQRKLNDEAKARMKAKFGGSGASMGGVGSDPSYRPGGGDDGGLGVGAALGSFWGNLSATTQSVASKAQEELAKREVGRKLREGWEATTSTLGDDEKRREASMAAKGAVSGLWGSLASKVADLANPDGDDNDGAFPTFYDPAAKAAAPSTGMVGIGGGSSGGGDEWDDWGDKRKPAPRRSSSSVSTGGGDGNNGASGAAMTECPGLPGEDRDGIAGLTGESEAQYAMRQTRIQNEAKERMRLKFGGGGSGMGGVGSSASSSSSSSASNGSSSSSLPRGASPPAIGGLRLSNSAPDVASPPKAPAPAGGSMPAPSPLSRAGSSTGSAPASAKKAAEVDFFNDFGM